MTSAGPNIRLLLRSDADTAARNIAVDEALLETAHALGRPVLRFYSWTEPAASFGYFHKYADIARLTHLRPLIRRPTGGGLVPHDADWTYSLAFPPDDPWYALTAVQSYARVHEWIQAAFAQMKFITELAAEARKTLPGQCFAGYEKSDVLWHGRKIAGAAQRRTRDGLLIQGSVQPPLRDISRSDWERAMRDVAQSQHGVQWREFQPTAEFQTRVAELATKKYSQRSHNERR